MSAYYISTAIDYPNGKPHLGHAYEKVIADMLARWHRLLGEDVFFITGTDENAQKIPEAAEQAGKDAHEFLEENVKIFQDLVKALDISCDRFIRTTEEQHKRIAREVFTTVHKKGDIYKGTYEGYYCVGCERFYTMKDLDGTKCKIHNREVQVVKEESYFFAMSKYQDQLIQHIKKHPEFIQPPHKRNEILQRLKEPLQDLSISRKNKNWGIPVPIDDTHSIYVWFDALINYISGLNYPSKDFEKYWPNSTHIIGKDITWFHTVIWPTMLMAADIPLPTRVHSHGFVNSQGVKLSKSSGVSVDPFTLTEKYGADALRYYLLREIPAGQDGDFSEEALIHRANADLADALGNLANRGAVLCKKYNQGIIPRITEFGEAETNLRDELNFLTAQSKTAILNLDWHRAVEHIWEFIHATNKYVNDKSPWKQEAGPARDLTIYTIIEAIRCISILTSAIVPQTAQKIADIVGQKIEPLAECHLKTTTTGTVTPAIAFAKLEAPTKDTILESSPEDDDPFAQLNFKVGVIETVENHPDADKLYVLRVNLGEEIRTIVAGLKAYLNPDDLLGKHALVLTNLKPAKLRGVKSQGMLLAAEKGDKLCLVQAPNAAAGTQVLIKGITPQTKNISYDTFAAITLTTKNHHVTYNGKPLLANDQPVIADIEDDADVR